MEKGSNVIRRRRKEKKEGEIAFVKIIVAAMRRNKDEVHGASVARF